MKGDIGYIYYWFIVLSYVVAQDPIANLPQGRIVGMKVFTEISLTPVEIFVGIPYATAPIGRYRFSAPERHAGWRGTLFARRMPPKCPQVGDNYSDYISEDCLFLNIWTPRRADGGSLPVAVVLYSESWEKGGITLPCQELAAEGVVVVTVAYRLHLLAFFTLKSIAARGNLALLDQYLALLWVRDNIAAFGGDPTLITIMGHSAGADSVLYHMSSPRSIGLFQRAIVMSPRNIWKTIDKELDVNSTATERLSLEMARSLGCASDVDQEILQCMRTRPLADIMALYSKVNWSNVMQPISDNFLPTGEQYLPTPLSVALSAVKQPMQLDLLLGTTDLEIINSNDVDYTELMKQGASYISEYANTKVIPDILQMFSLQQSEALPLLQQAIRWEFWGGKTRGNADRESLDSVEALARMETSAGWGAGGALLAARLARRVARLYVYRYLQPGADLQGHRHNFTGAVHGTDLVALLGDAFMLQVTRRHANPDEKRVSALFRRYIANFVKYGAPAPEEEWQRYKVGDAHVHDIAGDNLETRCGSRGATFWLQYLPQLATVLSTSSRTEQLTSENDGSRLRGGVFAMVGVSAALLMLLLACAVLLHRERSQRNSMAALS
ncbi:carboxylesterase 1C [Pectinophora gossypiella]|uniref:carboxylesterase 1C n=1 Tax=Pectinophora gossypiella TaxID=13191 RepID=UPI00214EEE15|nr:carboxylesterase 1C [Pectinophora gossypiella]